MKKELSLLLLSFCVSTALAQDVIVKHDGSTILSKVIEIGTTEVKYKKFSNQNGPTYSILKADILSINYENGEKDTFTDAQQPVKEETSDKPQITVATPAADNAEIIARYNRIYEHGEDIKDKAKPVKDGYCIMGVKENSVLSTNDIVIEFRQEPWSSAHDLNGHLLYDVEEVFFVQVHNKTDHVVYVDLGSTFRVMKDGSSKVYFDNSQTTISKSSGSGMGVNLGAIAGVMGVGGTLGTLANGVSVGGGSSTTVSKVYAQQRVMAIPPHGRIPLEKYKLERIKTWRFEIMSDGEELECVFNKEDTPIIMQGEKYFYNEENSPYHADYIITYSKDANFSNTYAAKASIYAREFIGGYQGRMITRKPEIASKKIFGIIPDYNEYTILGTFRTNK